jgi:hypothetical protein
MIFYGFGIIIETLFKFWDYSGFGTKLSPIFGFAKTPKYKPNFPLSQLPKSIVVAVGNSYFIRIFNFSEILFKSDGKIEISFRLRLSAKSNFSFVLLS